jgi:MFS superfamily sulfate permease-like transporter
MSEHRWLRPLPEWLVSYRADWLRPDIVAGLTTGAVIIPKAMAYAMIAGLPVQVDLYTALVPMVIYAALGTSRVLSVSTTTTLAILTAAQLGQVVPNGDPAALLRASATLALLVGAALVLACLLRLGFVENFISEPVLVGFRTGIGLVIVVDQVPKLLGIHFPRGTFVHNVLSTIHNLSRTSLPTLAVGLTVIAFLASIEHFMPKLPAPLLAAGAAIAGAYLLNLQDRGVELVGHIPQGLPSFTRPDLSLVTVLWPGALGIALMSFTGTMKGMLVAIIVSLVTLAHQMADPPVYVLRRKPGTNVFRPQSSEHPEDESFPGLLLLRPEGPIFFANAALIAHKIEPLIRESQPKVVAVDASGILDMEYTALKMFAQFGEKLTQHGIQLWLIDMTPEVLAIVKRSPLGQILRRGGMHFNLEIAVAHYLNGVEVFDQF